MKFGGREVRIIPASWLRDEKDDGFGFIFPKGGCNDEKLESFAIQYKFDTLEWDEKLVPLVNIKLSYVMIHFFLNHIFY